MSRVRTIAPGAAVVAALLSGAAPLAGAQSREGVYQVAGRDSVRGGYAGRAEVRWAGRDYEVIREVEYGAYRYQGRPVSTVWTGRAFDTPRGLQVIYSLDRMGWAQSGAGQVRTVADGYPLAVTANLSAAGAGLSGRIAGPGAPFVDRDEQWSGRAPLGAPIWRDERRVVPSHGAPSPWLRRTLAMVFESYRQTAWVAPYTGRPDFQSAIRAFVWDRTDFDLHRRRPDLLRVIGRIVDDLALEEAIVKANAFGRRLVDKQADADREVPTRFLDAGCIIGRSSSGAPRDDFDSCEWTGLYAWSQALRYRTTGEPAALANVEQVVEALAVHVEITGQPGVFARTLRTAIPGRAPTGLWRAGTGPFAGRLEWMVGGNNDMLKGLGLGAIAALEVLPAHHPLRPRLGRALESMWVHSPLARDGKYNEELITGAVSALLGPGAARDRYTKLGSNPFLQAYTAAAAAGFHFQGITDWSGVQLELATLMVRTRIADEHGRRTWATIDRIGIRRAAERQRRTRRAMHALAAAGFARLSFPWGGTFDAADAVWMLREIPHPRPTISHQHSLRADYTVFAYPDLPWKLDWTQDPGRARGAVAPPQFETDLTNFLWKDSPFWGQGRSAPGTSWSGNDYLLGYWMARAYGVIGPND